MFYAGSLLNLDAIDDAIVAADAARQRAEQRGALALLPMAFMLGAGARFYAGRWDDAIAEIEAGLAVIDDTGNVTFVLYHEALLAKIAIHRGDLARAQAHLTAGAEHLAGGVSLGADGLFGTQAEFLAARGQLDAALTVAETTWAQTAPTRYFPGHRDRGAFLVRHAVAAGRDELADAVTAELEEGALRSPAASAAGAALRCRGLVERDPDLVLDAVARYRETPSVHDLASCCEDAAGLLAAASRGQEAVTLLHEAAAIYTDIEATADSAHVDTALHALGVRRRRTRPSRPSIGWDSLTPMESAVSQLVAEGLTNPEIGVRLYISRRTVETHLSHVFRKVGLASRTQLAAELSRREIHL
jgi:DNA-binding CsgD family transcriptional regulator